MKPISPPEKIRVEPDVRGSVEIGVEHDVETEVEVEVDIVEREVIRTGSWVSEAFGEEDDALVGASQDCAVSGSQTEANFLSFGAKGRSEFALTMALFLILRTLPDLRRISP